jgi:hypothetical protein
MRKKAASPITDELAERVNYHFHHSLLNDSQIAARIRTNDDLATTANQVKEIRLLFNWRHRHYYYYYYLFILHTSLIDYGRGW